MYVLPPTLTTTVSLTQANEEDEEEEEEEEEEDDGAEGAIGDNFPGQAQDTFAANGECQRSW